MDIYPDAFFPCSAAKLRQVITLAEKHRAETVEKIREYLTAARRPVENSKNKNDRKEAARWTALLDVLDPPEKKSPAAKAAERIAAENRDARPDYCGVFQSGGKHCVCNGYMLVRFNDPVPLPTVPGGLNAAGAVERPRTYDEPFPLPTLKEAKNLLKLAKALRPGTWAGKVYRLATRGYFYDPGEGLPAVNLQYLADMLEALPGCTAYHGRETAPIYFTAETGDGLLMPMKKEPRYYASRPATRSATAVCTMTPEEFAELYAPAAMTPEEFAQRYAA